VFTSNMEGSSKTARSTFLEEHNAKSQSVL